MLGVVSSFCSRSSASSGSPQGAQPAQSGYCFNSRSATICVVFLGAGGGAYLLGNQNISFDIFALGTLVTGIAATYFESLTSQGVGSAVINHLVDQSEEDLRRIEEAAQKGTENLKLATQNGLIASEVALSDALNERLATTTSQEVSEIYTSMTEAVSKLTSTMLGVSSTKETVKASVAQGQKTILELTNLNQRREARLERYGYGKTIEVIEV